eukprot:899296-Prorocentrum_minimum.AAC.1
MKYSLRLRSTTDPRRNIPRGFAPPLALGGIFLTAALCHWPRYPGWEACADLSACPGKAFLLATKPNATALPFETQPGWDVRMPLPLLVNKTRSLVVELDAEGVTLTGSGDSGEASLAPLIRPFQRRYWVDFEMCWPPELELDAFTGLQVFDTFQVGAIYDLIFMIY